MLIIPGFPDHDYLLDRDVTTPAFVITQMNNVRLNTQNLTAQTRAASAVKVNPFSDEFRK
jgi:hypothetical protein